MMETAKVKSVRGMGVFLAALLLTGQGCATLAGSWDYGLPKDDLPTEDRLWHIVFPLSVVAADSCVFKREETYGFFLKDAAPASVENSGQIAPPQVLVRYVHAQLPAGKAGVQIGDTIVGINGDPVRPRNAEAVSAQIQRLTRAKIQPLMLRLLRRELEYEVNLWAVPACRMQVKLVESPVVNALSNGSSILVTSGLLRFVRSPDQLAWVLAHELGHHALEHAERAKLNTMLNRFLSSMTGETPQPIRQIDLERQADVFAADLMVRAGFDLREARRLLGWIQILQSEPSANDLKRSHPSNQERLDAMDRMIRELDEKRAIGEQPLLDQSSEQLPTGTNPQP
jgi:beta-barrel assembly-enhancing protease